MAGPSDIQRAFGGRVFGVVGHREEGQGWGGSAGDLQSLALRFTVHGEGVQVETSTSDPGEESPLARLVLRVFRSPPPLPLTLTFEERAARLRVCGREHDFKCYVCGGRSIAFAPVGDLWVTVELPTAFLDSQAFELDDEAEVRSSDEP
jgi:hypothetical protein